MNNTHASSPYMALADFGPKDSEQLLIDAFKCLGAT
jgi:hypothetical protein